MGRIPLIGGSYESRSLAVDAQKTVNLYVERVESGTGKTAVLYPTPGLIYFGTLSDTPGRGLFTDQERVYAVAGGTFYEVLSNGTSVVLGHVANDGRRVSFNSNGLQGHQLFIVSGKYGYIFDTKDGAFTPLTTVPDFPSGEAIDGAFLDGYFIVATHTSFFISDLFNGLPTPADPTATPPTLAKPGWAASEQAIRSMGSDNIVAIMQNHREIWVWGEVTSEIWYDAGVAEFPFAPIQGVFVEMGCGAPDSPVRFDNNVIWLASNRDGDRMVVQAAQYVPQRVSTHACEVAWRRYAKTDDAIGLVYQEDGHNFYVLTFPDAEATWCYDAATKLWHERAYWNVTLGKWEAHRANCHCRGFDKHIVGDRANGNLYIWSNHYSLDNTDEIRRLRRTGHIRQENQWLFFERLELEMEMGLQPQPPEIQTDPPRFMLRWSDDRAHTWSPEQWVSAGKMGEYSARAYWTRLGRSRDRVFEITMTSQIPWHLIDGYVSVAAGSH